MSPRRTLLAACLLLGGACDFSELAARSSIRMIERAAPALQRSSDPDLVEAAMPSSIATLEGLLEVQPASATVRMLLARSYCSYAYGFLEDRMEQAEERGDLEAAARYRERAALAYARGREVAFGMLARWEGAGGGPAGHQQRGLEAWTRYLRRFGKGQVPILFWGAYAWVRHVGVNRDDPASVAELPYASAMIERVLVLDSTYNHHAPRLLRAGLLASVPEALGGKPREACQEFEEVIRLTGRRNLMYLVMEAVLVAYALQDRDLYRSLLEEVIAAGDVDPDNRLSNVLARRRAVRYLEQIDRLFAPPDPVTPHGAP